MRRLPSKLLASWEQTATRATLSFGVVDRIEHVDLARRTLCEVSRGHQAERMQRTRTSRKRSLRTWEMAPAQLAFSIIIHACCETIYVHDGIWLCGQRTQEFEDVQCGEIMMNAAQSPNEVLWL